MSAASLSRSRSRLAAAAPQAAPADEAVAYAAEPARKERGGITGFLTGFFR